MVSIIHPYPFVQAQKELQERAKCPVCHRSLLINRYYFSIQELQDGRWKLAFSAADTGYNRGKTRDTELVGAQEIAAAARRLGVSSVPRLQGPWNLLATEPEREFISEILRPHIFTGDFNQTWHRLRCMFSIRYKHSAGRSQSCAPYHVVTIARTYLKWASPLLYILYGLGLSYDGMLRIMRGPGAPLERAPAADLGAAIRRMVLGIVETSTTTASDARILHESNRRGHFQVALKEVSFYDTGFPYGWRLEIAGALDELTLLWLGAVCQEHGLWRESS